MELLPDSRQSGRVHHPPTPSVQSDLVSAWPSVEVSLYAPFFRALNSAGIRYVVVGGLATILHGHARLTADVDLILDLKEEPAKKAIHALTEYWLRP